LIRFAVPALALIATGLITTIAWEAGAFSSAVATVPRPPRAMANNPVMDQAPDRIPQWVAMILARPLFSPDRRPAAEAAGQAFGVSQGLPRLSGVLVSPSARTAIFARGDSKPIVVREGGRIDAYTVQSIEAGQVHLLGANGLLVLHPNFLSAPPAQPAGLTAPHSVGQTGPGMTTAGVRPQ
jgi:hypothetical protein